MATRLVFARLVRRLYLEPESMPRNRYFATFESGDGVRARRIASHLRSLRADLLAGGGQVVVAAMPDGRVMLTLARPTPLGSRVAWLSTEELGILREDRAVDALLPATDPDRRS